MPKTALNDTPEWVKHAIFYQIFPDRFAKSDKVQHLAGLESWDSPPTVKGYKGGNLYGIIEKLDYLQDLGITAIYLCPIFSATSNHRYNTQDFFHVDPMLGGDEALDDLIKAVHDRDMKIVLDGVFNHTDRSFLPFADIIENNEASPYRDWFKILNYPPNAYDVSRPADYWAWWNLHQMPKLNHDNPEVQEYIFSIAEYWLKKGIDGWRLDVATEITADGFWEEFRRRVRAVNPEAYIVGENWVESKEWVNGERFDAVMNYVFTENVIRFCAGERVVPESVEGRDYNVQKPIDGIEYAKKTDNLLDLYDWHHTCVQMNLLDSHDTARLITIAGGDKSTVELATLLMFTFPGAPCIYYGDEIGLEGSLPSYDTRRPMPWHQAADWNTKTINLHKNLIQLRKNYSALRTGKYLNIYADKSVIIFARKLKKQYLLVAINVSEDDQSVTIQNVEQNFSSIKTVWGKIMVHLSQIKIRFELPKRSGGVFLLTSQEI